MIGCYHCLSDTNTVRLFLGLIFGVQSPSQKVFGALGDDLISTFWTSQCCLYQPTVGHSIWRHMPSQVTERSLDAGAAIPV